MTYTREQVILLQQIARDAILGQIDSVDVLHPEPGESLRMVRLLATLGLNLDKRLRSLKIADPEPITQPAPEETKDEKRTTFEPFPDRPGLCRNCGDVRSMHYTYGEYCGVF